MQVLFSGGKFQWKRLQNLIRLAKEGSGGLDLSDTVASGARVVLLDERLRAQLLQALTEDNRLHIDVSSLLTLHILICSTPSPYRSTAHSSYLYMVFAPSSPRESLLLLSMSENVRVWTVHSCIAECVLIATAL